MIVAIGFPVVAARAISKIDFENQAGCFQIAQRVVNGCIADAGQALAGSLKDIAGGRVVISLLDHLKNRFPLRRQFRLFVSVLVCVLHDGFRLILNRGFVKWPTSRVPSPEFRVQFRVQSPEFRVQFRVQSSEFKL